MNGWMSATRLHLALMQLEEVLEIARYGRRNRRTVELHGPSTRSIIVNGTPIVAADGAPMGGIALVKDATGGHHSEVLMREFVANVSHELKTPIGALGLVG